MYSSIIKKSIVFVIILSLTGCGIYSSATEISIPIPSTVYDVYGRRVDGLTPLNQISVNLSEISPFFINAVIATEDKSFYSHHGIDVIGISRAFYNNLRQGKIVGGGSTITQQTAKNLFLSNEQTIIRKIKELFLAFKLEKQYSKDEILTMYCNTIYFGHGAYGVESAARVYLGKKAKDLTLAEAALLAGLTQWPSHYDPYVNPDESYKRQRLVLQRMVEENMITEEDKKEAQAQTLTFTPADFMEGEAPYFIAMVKNYLIEKYGERMVYQGGLQIYTTLDMDLQRAANMSYIEGMKERDPNMQAALVALDSVNSEIRALIGGRDFISSPYNRVCAKRQPGSTFKPFMYSLAVDWGWTPATLFLCEEVEYKLANGDIYRPADYGNDPYHWREFTLKEALMISDNIIAVEMNNQLGPQNTAEYAAKFGFDNIKPVLSLPLGSNVVSPLDLAAGYAVLANGGNYSQPYYIIKVETKNGVVLEESQAVSTRVIGADTAYVVTNMLQGVMAPGGTGYGMRQYIGENVQVAGKTGTTDEFNDSWFVGYSPSLVCAVWLGYDDNKPVNLSGGRGAGPIWGKFMAQSLAKLGEQVFVKPGNVTIMNICLDSGQIAVESCPRTIDMAFINGTEPDDFCYLHSDYWNIFEEETPSEERKNIWQYWFNR